MPFISLLLRIYSANVSTATINIYGEMGQQCLTPQLTGKKLENAPFIHKLFI